MSYKSKQNEINLEKKDEMPLVVPDHEVIYIELLCQESGVIGGKFLGLEALRVPSMKPHSTEDLSYWTVTHSNDGWGTKRLLLVQRRIVDATVQVSSLSSDRRHKIMRLSPINTKFQKRDICILMS
ncbi:hypothetical protein AVEN_142631-1 [Araneus ventricosus]|uniref:Uncharacterized protein n=1 Tax=Araneus ventricosus TaxID=182803 RepID=A0A4Y2TN03_ARAVE|nr:hypothetical protein AVEN_142631-1 [Araneus ventricosus]